MSVLSSGGRVAYVGGISRVGCLEGSGNGYRRGVSVATTSHPDLGAGDIELGDACGPGVMDAQRLDAQEVLSVGDARGDSTRIVS